MSPLRHRDTAPNVTSLALRAMRRDDRSRRNSIATMENSSTYKQGDWRKCKHILVGNAAKSPPFLARRHLWRVMAPAIAIRQEGRISFARATHAVHIKTDAPGGSSVTATPTSRKWVWRGGRGGSENGYSATKHSQRSGGKVLTRRSPEHDGVGKPPSGGEIVQLLQSIGFAGASNPLG